jgi:hypothetical protein
MKYGMVLRAILPCLMVLAAVQAAVSPAKEYRVISPDKKTEAVLALKEGRWTLSLCSSTGT